MTFANGLMFLGLAIAFFSLYHYMKATNRKMSWWKWVLTVLWGSLLMLSFAVVFTFVGEGEPQAAGPGALFFGIILLVTGVLLWRLLFSETFLPGKKKAEPAKKG